MELIGFPAPREPPFWEINRKTIFLLYFVRKEVIKLLNPRYCKCSTANSNSGCYFGENDEVFQLFSGGFLRNDGSGCWSRWSRRFKFNQEI